MHKYGNAGSFDDATGDVFWAGVRQQSSDLSSLRMPPDPLSDWVARSPSMIQYLQTMNQDTYHETIQRPFTNALRRPHHIPHQTIKPQETGSLMRSLKRPGSQQELRLANSVLSSARNCLRKGARYLHNCCW